jgi:dimethyladenosine transferase 2, mitochondrial
LINADISKLPEHIEPCRNLTLEDYPSNMNIYTEFGDLTPTQVLTIFDQFVHWPEFKESSFTTSLENVLFKILLNPDNPESLPEELRDEDELPTNVDKKKVSDIHFVLPSTTSSFRGE